MYLVYGVTCPPVHPLSELHSYNYVRVVDVAQSDLLYHDPELELSQFTSVTNVNVNI